MELSVQIQKRMKSFELAVAFNSAAGTLGVLGPSGSGKSMTLRCIAGLETPDRGCVLLDGRALLDTERGVNVPSRKRRVGFLLQDYALFPHMSVEENIAFGIRALGRAEAGRRVREQIGRVRLNGLERRYPRELSGGEQQRTALARALATDPEILLLDEPLSALDVHLRSQMESLLLETLSAFKGVSLYVTHNLEEAYRIAEEIVVISNGHEMAFGPKETIFRHPPNHATAEMTGCKNFSRARRASCGEIEALDWGCRLTAQAAEHFEWIAIRAHHIALSGRPREVNSVPCRLARVIEGPFRMTLHLEILLPGAPPAQRRLQAEVTRETWERLRSEAFPWYAQLAPDKLMLF